MLVAWTCLIMGIGVMGVSVYYSLQWFLTRGMPPVIAYMMAIFYVVFTNFVFEFAIARLKKFTLHNNKLKVLGKGTHAYTVSKIHARSYLITGLLIFLAWSLLSLFSMFCTVGGQYEQLINMDTSKAAADVQDYTKQIENREKMTKSLESEIEGLQSRTDGVDSVEKRYQYKNTTGQTEDRLDSKRQELKLLNDELEELYVKQNKKAYADKQGVSHNSFYVYISEVLKGRVSPLGVQFSSAIFPSVVIDILSPICLTIFVLSWEKRKRK